MLAHDLRGSGPNTVFVLHGFLGSGRNLASLARRWSDSDASLRLVLPDLTGHGASPPLPPGADLTTVAGDVLALADALSVPRPLRLVGHSLGGRVALAARALAGAGVGQVTLLDIAPGPIPQLSDDLAHLLQRLLVAPATCANRAELRDFFTQDGIPGPLADWILMNLVSDGGTLHWRIDRQALGAFHRRITGPDLWPVADGLGAQLRCIRGGRSGFVSAADVARMQARGARVDTLADAGHFVHIDNQAGLLNLLME